MISIRGGVLCCGNLVRDTLVRPVDAIRFDTTAWVEAIETSLGGNGANTAYAIAMLGAPVRLRGYLGADAAGDWLLGCLRGAGVDLELIQRFEGERTAATVALVNSTGARAFLHEPGVSRVAFADAVEFTENQIAECSHFHLGNPFTSPGLRARAGEMLSNARAAGLTTSMDAGWDWRGEWLAVVGPCLPHLDIFFANEEEVRMLSGRSETSEGVRFLLGYGVPDVIVKTGPLGCRLFSGAQKVEVPAFAVEAVDTTGAGDCFAGGFLAGLHHGMDILAALRLANAAGALSVTKVGAVTGLRRLPQTLEWMNAQ